ncbi:hypothetical protein [Agromyces seonyuensis]|uniref:hypothetical protein n=1 Tax=Agromyces seonyuensis TaxID=2662446 RepID=UPI0019241054|nr:hypothetical protein [Agromyces seonyuensis]
MNGVLWVIMFGLFSLGVWLFSAAFAVVGFEAPIFILGILLVSASLAIPFHVLGQSQKN